MSKKQPTSDLHELLKLLRRIVVLAVGAYGLARGMPYVALVVRLALLWAVLYVSSGLIDVVIRRLSYRAALRAGVVFPSEQSDKLPAMQKAGQT
ncbi:MAG: hypothetical protein NT025_07625 [bacterium]|nr:hypothetical protein [bacterium]